MRLPREYGPSLVVLGAAAAVLLAGPLVVRELGHRHRTVRAELAGERLEGNVILAELNQAFRDIAVAVEPSVVHIAADQMRPGQGGASSLSTGSGWIYDDMGHVVTNHHVVSNSRRIEVQLADGSLRPADLVGSDPLTDIAVVRIEPTRTTPARRRPLGEAVEQGDLVFAFGSPFDFRFSMSQGVVSGKDRYAGVLARGPRRGYENFIQVDAAINPGNSGGPLTDSLGRVIGMNTAIATTGQRSAGDEGRFAGIGLAIPLDMIEPVVDQIIDRGYALQGFLGVTPLEIMPLDRVRLGFDALGIIVGRVERGTAADEAGLQVDDIVTAINGAPIQNRSQLFARIGTSPPGTRIELSVQRMTSPGSFDELSVPVTLRQRDSLEDDGRLPPNQSRSEIIPLGIAAMETSSRPRARELGIRFVPGVLVTDWVAGSIRDRADLDNAVITSTNGIPVNGVEEFLRALGTVRLDANDPRGGSPTNLRLADGSQALIYLRDLRRP